MKSVLSVPNFRVPDLKIDIRVIIYRFHYKLCSETITGAVTIRALRKQQQESLKNARLVEANQRVQFSILASNCWLNFRLTVGIGVTVIGVSTLVAVVQHEYAHADPALVGLALTYAMPLTGILSAVMRDFLSTELGFISVERISQFSNLPSKAFLWFSRLLFSSKA